MSAAFCVKPFWDDLMRALLALVMLPAVLCAAPAAGQPAPTGAPFSTTHFTAQDYRAQSQNWSIAQDERGLMYVANNDGILQYDGARWRLIETGTGTFTRSVAADSQGTVYAGTVGDFGVLRPDSTATLRYVSLADRLPPEQRGFSDVWNTHATGGDVYFQSREQLFRWNGDTLRSWKSETETFHTSFVVHGEFYVRESGRGLLRMEGDSLNVVPGGEGFADNSIYVMVPHGSGKILVGTSQENFFLYDGTSFEPFPTEVDALLEDTQLYHGTRLPGGEVVLATLGEGVFIIDRRGRLVQVLDQQTGLPDGTVNHVYPDGQGGLWMALHNSGVFHAEVSSPLSRFGKGFGLEGIVQDFYQQDGAFHTATGAGVYRFMERTTEARPRYRFEKVPGVPAAWDLLSPGNALYAATRGGVYRIEERQGTRLAGKKAFSLATPSTRTPRRLFVGTAEGVDVLQRREGGWRLNPLARTQSEVRSVKVTEKSGALWFSTLDGTVFRIAPRQLQRARAEPRAPVRPQRFDTTDGLPGGTVSVASFRGAPIFMSKKGLYHTRAARGDTTFYRDTTLTGAARRRKGPLRAFYEADSSKAWLFYDDRVEVARRQANGTYAREMPPVLQIFQFSGSNMVRARIGAEGGVWISNQEELIRYDDARAQRLRGARRDTPRVLIRQVRDAVTGDLIYGGAAPPEHPVEVPYRQNSVRVAFGWPQYGPEVDPRYQYRLGDGQGWSEWQPSAEVVLDRLGEGTYAVEVRARDADEKGIRSRASLTLKVLPPWYRTVWAYLAYAGLGVLAVLAARRYRRLRAERREARRAAQRHQRETEREREARRKLQEARDRLEEANRLKENFLANTSHEFRTPLSSIIGYAEVLQDDELPREQQQEFLGVIRRSGERLLDTVTMLLEISQLHAGTLDPDPGEMEVNQQVKEAVTPFRQKAEDKGLSFRFAPAPAPMSAKLPARYFRRIIENLVDNAVKFTQEGTVRVLVCGTDAGEVRVEVRDTGVGMAHPEALFAEFKQASEGTKRAHEGSGLGLTIAGRLARLMGGSIEVESTKDEGSRFTVRLPRTLDLDTDDVPSS